MIIAKCTDIFLHTFSNIPSLLFPIAMTFWFIQVAIDKSCIVYIYHMLNMLSNKYHLQTLEREKTLHNFLLNVKKVKSKI